MSFIQFIGLEKSFGEKKIYKGVNLKIEKGETITVLGGSGSGKTVMLKMLLGLMFPDAGKILFDGKDVVDMTDEEILGVRRRVGMLFQGGALFDSLSVKENVAYPLREHFQHTEEEIARIVAEKLELVGLPGIEEMAPSDLSGGMKKRVSLARAIATSPEVILYDEPTTGLDPTNTRRIDNVIINLQKKLGVTSIVVTHDIQSAFYISDRLALLYDGKIRFVGSKAEVKNSDDPVVQGFIKGDMGDVETPQVISKIRKPTSSKVRNHAKA
ncbi:MAG TPA: ABC transporter ATP-binding protein [bacterium]|nr:ABC transporter ATP-binding protein [bacterium]